MVHRKGHIESQNKRKRSSSSHVSKDVNLSTGKTMIPDRVSNYTITRQRTDTATITAEELRERKRELIEEILSFVEAAYEAVKKGVIPEWEYNVFCYEIAGAAGIIVR